MQKELQKKLNYAEVGEEISHATAGAFVKTYADANPTDLRAHHIGRNIIEQILAQPGCCGIRFYNAINEIGQKTLVYVGIDANGNDLIKRTIVAQDGSLVVSNFATGDRAGGSGDNSVLEAIRTWLGF